MTLLQALHAIDTALPNAYEQSEKVAWLSVLDGIVWQEIVLSHEGAEGDFDGYGSDTAPDTLLLVAAPYDRELYLRFLESRIHYCNGDTARFNNALEQFKSAYSEFARFYNRSHLPKGSKRKFW